MSELVDREAVKNMFCSECEVITKIKEQICKDSGCWITKRIDEVPAAPRWVRVEEKMPEDGETVLIYGRMKYEWEKEYEYFEDAAEYLPWDRGWVTWNDWYEGQHHFEILYWMPLPEPPGEEADG